MANIILVWPLHLGSNIVLIKEIVVLASTSEILFKVEGWLNKFYERSLSRVILVIKETPLKNHCNFTERPDERTSTLSTCKRKFEAVIMRFVRFALTHSHLQTHLFHQLWCRLILIHWIGYASCKSVRLISFRSVHKLRWNEVVLFETRTNFLSLLQTLVAH